ncbi:MAG: type II toxin-antitoxin system PemK/MazF family toxin [Gammaproteobacteria bacterium]|nr:type II toxin-antitoxin system PemK/MazF family toxin [Gammaproteobacteria bacterium]MDE0480655.1 type II toxin-antitoxin system PemK/MazF family toxin [Gammaproteobacteria bacterium]MDE0507672.1 type II toxin-antitoxin system PemK/MazF family toxin [Gammaproteobacteria bacterium]
MPLNFVPRPGTLLICDFDTGFRPPEMVKKRPVVVISPRRRRGNALCTVVPLSTTPPRPVEPFHHRMDARSLPGSYAMKETWAKCDLVATVARDRLDRVLIRENQSERREYVAMRITAEDLAAIRRGVAIALGLGDV